jgi:magnesium transporter
VSIEALLYSGDGSDEQVDLREWNGRSLRGTELLWVDLLGPDADEIDVVHKALKLSDSAVDALTTDVVQPDAAVLEGAVMVSVMSFSEGTGHDPIALQILVGKEWVVTRHAEPMPMLDDNRERIRDERQIGRLTPIQFLVSLLDWHVDAFFRAAEDLEREVDELDDAALRTEAELLNRLVETRRRIARIRRIGALHRDVFAELGRPDFLRDIDEADGRAIEHVTERLERAVDAIIHVREMLIGTFDVHMTRTAQRTNDVMRVLTLATVILLPGSLIAGIMGMNFQVALFNDPSMFWVVIGAMALIATATLVVSRLRGWL